MGKATTIGCLFMAALFAYSASVQLDDIDWYFWFPLYTLASFISLFHTVMSTSVTRGAALAALLFGLILFLKVVAEGCIQEGRFNLQELLSLDMEKRAVREKLGSLLVVLAMWLQLEIFGSSSIQRRRKSLVGMWLFIAASSGLCVAYFFRL